MVRNIDKYLWMYASISLFHFYSKRFVLEISPLFLPNFGSASHHDTKNKNKWTLSGYHLIINHFEMVWTLAELIQPKISS